jgi:hypothetical protein
MRNGNPVSHDPNTLCYGSISNTVITCTENSSDGSSLFWVATKQGPSYFMASDLAGVWNLNVLDIMKGYSYWGEAGITVDGSGSFRSTETAGDGKTKKTTGAVLLSSDGKLACVNGACNDPTFEGFMDAGKTVMAATTGGGPSDDDARLFVFTRAASSYSSTDLVGLWAANRLDSGGVWERMKLLIASDGTFTQSGVSSDGTMDSGNGKLAISTAGVISCVSGDCSGFDAIMDSSKTVMVQTATDSGSGGNSISVLTKVADPLKMRLLDATAAPLDTAKPGVAVGLSKTTSSGSLKVTISPAAAVTAGAKWNVDGGSTQASGATVGSLSVGYHTVGFNTVNGWNSPAAQKVSISNGKTTAIQVTYVQQTGFITGITVGPSSSKAGWAVDGGAWHAGGVKVTVPVGSHTVSFRAVSGWETPGPQTVTVTNGGNTEVTGNYIQPLFFNLRGSLGTVAKGGYFSYQIGRENYGGGAGAPYTFSLNTGSFPPMGITVAPSGLISGTDASPPGVYNFSICVADAAGTEACTPSDPSITVTGGSLTVTIDPADAVAAGAQWNVNGGGWQSSGATVSGLAVGQHTVSFSSVSGWKTPSSKTVTIVNGKTASTTGTYIKNSTPSTPQAGDYSESCSASISSFQCCADGDCETFPGYSASYSTSIVVQEGWSLSELNQNDCAKIISAMSQAGCESPSCSIKEYSDNSFTISLSCTVPGGAGCTSPTLSASCNARLQ